MEARLFFGGLREGVNGAWVLARSTFRLGPSTNSLVPAEEQWPLFTEPLTTEFGVFPPDDYPFRRKSEVIVVGAVRSRRLSRYLQPRLHVGSFTDELAVFGNRRWVKQKNELVPSQPEPFNEMDLGLKNAFGGKTEYGGEPVPHPLNPLGKGFYVSIAQAEGGVLPNVERTDSTIRRWNDQPTIGTWSPVPDGVTWQMAAWIQARDQTRKSAHPPPKGDEEEQIRKEVQAHAQLVFPTAAPPQLLLASINPGDLVALELGDDQLQFQLPPGAPVVQVRVGKRPLIRTSKVVGVWILIPKQLVVVTWMARFRYQLRPGELRLAMLKAS